MLRAYDFNAISIDRFLFDLQQKICQWWKWHNSCSFLLKIYFFVIGVLVNNNTRNAWIPLDDIQMYKISGVVILTAAHLPPFGMETISAVYDSNLNIKPFAPNCGRHNYTTRRWNTFSQVGILRLSGIKTRVLRWSPYAFDVGLMVRFLFIRSFAFYSSSLKLCTARLSSSSTCVVGVIFYVSLLYPRVTFIVRSWRTWWRWPSAFFGPVIDSYQLSFYDEKISFTTQPIDTWRTVVNNGHFITLQKLVMNHKHWRAVSWQKVLLRRNCFP